MFLKIHLLYLLLQFNLLNCSPTRIYKYVDPKRFITNLPDSFFMFNLALIGTYQSASLKTTSEIKSQNLTIKGQLESGIRVLDLHLCLENNQLKLLYGPITLPDTINEVFEEIHKFFLQNPKELVIVLMKIEEDSKFSDITECQAVEKLIDKWSARGLPLRGKWSLLEDSIGEHRGQVLLSHVNNQDFDGCTTYLPCEVENNWFEVDLEKKWQEIAKSENDVLNPYHQYHSCYINYLESLNPFLFTHPKNQSNEVQLRMKQIKEINHRMAKKFENPVIMMTIIMTEFPGKDLVNSIISSNF